MMVIVRVGYLAGSAFGLVGVGIREDGDDRLAYFRAV